MTGGDKRREENSKLSGLLRKSGSGGIVHQRGHAAAGGQEQCSAPGKWARSAPALAAPTDTADKTAKRGESALGASGSSSPDPNHALAEAVPR